MFCWNLPVFCCGTLLLGGWSPCVCDEEPKFGQDNPTRIVCEVEGALADLKKVAAARRVGPFQIDAFQCAAKPATAGGGAFVLASPVEEPRPPAEPARAPQPVGDAVDAGTGARIDLGTPAVVLHYSPDGMSILAGGPAEWKDDGREWPGVGGRVVRLLPNTKAVETLLADVQEVASGGSVFSVDGRSFVRVTGVTDDDVQRADVYELSTGKIKLTMTISGRFLETWNTTQVIRSQLLGDDKTLFTYQRNGDASLWDLATGVRLKRVALAAGVKKPPAMAVPSPDGKQFASVDEDAVLRLWTLETGKDEVVARDVDAKNLLFSPDSTSLAVAAKKSVGIWNLPTRKKLELVGQGGNGFILTLAFSPDSARFASATWQPSGQRRPEYRGTVVVWDVKTGQPLRTISGLPEGTRDMAFSPDGTQLATCSPWETFVRLFELRGKARD